MKRLTVLLAMLAIACGDDASPMTAEDAGSVSGDAGTVMMSDAGVEMDAAIETDGGVVEMDAGQVDSTAPTLEVTRPRSGRMTPARTVWVQGTAADETELASLKRVAGDEATAIEVAEDGTFGAMLALEPGANDVLLRATDAAGNVSEETVAVYFGHRISSGNSQAMMIDGDVFYSWGRNELGQLGNGTLDGSRWGDDPATAMLPVAYEVSLPLTSIVTRQTFALGLGTDGQVHTWGANDEGQLGYDTPVDCGSRGNVACGRAPMPVAGLNDVVGIAAGFDHVVVLREDGTVWSWGANGDGQLGHSAGENNVMTPTQVPGLENIVQVAAGATLSLALTEDGEVYTWGENDRGQLGLGSSDGDAHPMPAMVPGLENVESLAAANAAVLAVRRDGSALAWGHNHRGQAGVGSEEDEILVPTAIVIDDMETPIAGVENVAGDGFIGMVQTSDGRVFTMGFGFLGQLGQGYLDDGERDLENRNIASEVSVADIDREDFNIVEIEVGAGGPGLAFSEGGELFGWGWSFQGSLGIDGAINAWAYSAPVLIRATGE